MRSVEAVNGYKQVYQKELQALGDLVEHLDVQVNEDKMHGLLAVITIKLDQSADEDAVKQQVDRLLSAYSTRYRLEVIHSWK